MSNSTDILDDAIMTAHNQDSQKGSLNIEGTRAHYLAFFNAYNQGHAIAAHQHLKDYAQKTQELLDTLRALKAVTKERDRLRDALVRIDAQDPEWQGIECLSFGAAKGLILSMGEIARKALDTPTPP
jgi:sigma54-dependent transcription regulator